VGQDGAAYKSDLGETRSEKYLQMGLDRGIDRFARRAEARLWGLPATLLSELPHCH
jgi:hypothetical protein